MRNHNVVAVAALLLVGGTATAQVKQVHVGLTPSCPYGIAGCWGGAREALGRLDGVETVGTAPDVYNSTAQICLRDGKLPDPEAMQKQFKSMVGDLWAFRGVEVTVEGKITVADGKPVLNCPGVDRPITLVPLKNKLQYNFQKHAVRQPEPDEATAHRDIMELIQKNKSVVERPWFVTGPLSRDKEGYVLEVREAFATK
jgi:galactose oxidase